MIKKMLKKLLFPNTWCSEAYVKFLREGGCNIGQGTFFYTPRETLIDETSLRYIEIGENCQITRGVIILAHDYSYSVIGNVFNDLPRKQKVTKVGNNVFIGMNSIILMGAEIGSNVIIGAGSVVSGRVESNSVYAGNPAKKICTLEEHYQRLSGAFINSAKIYAEGFIKQHNKVPNISEMNVYRTLFLQSDDLEGTFVGVNKDTLLTTKEKMKAKAEFKSVEELMKFN